MTPLFKSLALSCALLFTLPQAVHAAEIPAKGLTLEAVADWLRGEGYRAQIVEEDGERRIKSALEGVNFEIFADDCDGADCLSLHLSTGFDLKEGITLEKANTWNRNKRWAAVSLDDENDPYLSMDVSLAPGSSFEALTDSLGIWSMMVRDMKTFIDW
ncbi:MAG: YbjN domain-containing protein [Caulobacter sp.]|nr:YbjN domain-containing protein [Caulobacter sp.]